MTWPERGCDAAPAASAAGVGAREAHPQHFKRCAACRTVAYCSRKHQVADWPGHKAACKAARQAASMRSKSTPSLQHPLAATCCRAASWLPLAWSARSRRWPTRRLRTSALRPQAQRYCVCCGAEHSADQCRCTHLHGHGRCDPARRGGGGRAVAVAGAAAELERYCLQHRCRRGRCAACRAAAVMFATQLADFSWFL